MAIYELLKLAVFLKTLKAIYNYAFICNHLLK